jgi:hypothetical protein
MMKKIFLVLCLLLTAKFSIAQSIDWSAVRQRYIEKYEPQKVPAWLFPMIFKEGNGGRDTVYFGYDSLAENFSVLGNDYFDTLLGEKPELADTSAFYAYVADFLDLPSIIKVDLEPANYLAFEMAFHNGILPVTIYWDVSAFR